MMQVVSFMPPFQKRKKYQTMNYVYSHFSLQVSMSNKGSSSSLYSLCTLFLRYILLCIF